MFSAHPGVESDSGFHSQIAKKATLEPVLQFSDQRSQKVAKMNPKWDPGEPQHRSKINKIPTLEPKVACRVSLGTTGSSKWWPRSLKCTPRVSKWSPQTSKSLVLYCRSAVNWADGSTMSSGCLRVSFRSDLQVTLGRVWE